MDIYYLGHSAFKLKGKNAVVVIDPFDPKTVGIKFPKTEADILTISHQHPDHNFKDGLSGIEFVVDAPGEYEVKDVSIIGIPTYHDSKKGEERGRNIIYVYEMDGLRLVHMGDLGHVLSEKEVQELGEIDVVMIPVGGNYTIGSKEAVNIIQDIEPSLILPMHYQIAGENPDLFAKLAPLDSFLSEMGLPVERLPKLTVKKDLLGEEQKVVILEYK